MQKPDYFIAKMYIQSFLYHSIEEKGNMISIFKKKHIKYEFTSYILCLAWF